MERTLLADCSHPTEGSELLTGSCIAAMVHFRVVGMADPPHCVLWRLRRTVETADASGSHVPGWPDGVGEVVRAGHAEGNPAYAANEVPAVTAHRSIGVRPTSAGTHDPGRRKR